MALTLGGESEVIRKHFNIKKSCVFIMIFSLMPVILAFVIAINESKVQILIPPLPNINSSELSTMDSTVCYACIMYFSMCKNLVSKYDVSIALYLFRFVLFREKLLFKMEN